MPSKKDISGKTSAKHDEPSSKRPSVSWPDFEPASFVGNLSFHELHPGQILTVSDFWTPALCKKYVSFLSKLPLTSTPGKPKKGEALRVNDRFQVDDPAFAEKLWTQTGLRVLVMQARLAAQQEDIDAGPLTVKQRCERLFGGVPIGLNPNIRIYRYRKGQFFDQHYDVSNSLTHPGPPSTAAHTTWTLLIYLTSRDQGCYGGETVFYPEPYLPAGATSKKARIQPDPIVVGLETGMALLHKHGTDCMLHEGREVTDGEKWVIRSDLCVKR